tara:strand:- start:938 stop:1081 length:144 start_codon:yes stop_codon:yes gene_type:complete
LPNQSFKNNLFNNNKKTIKTGGAFLFFIEKLKTRTNEIGEHLSGRNC